jgi:two-component system heavy metal sensor histidine kinase CusS
LAVRRPLSLAMRVTLLFGVVTAIVFPMFGWVIVQSTENHFRTEDGDELEIIAGTVSQVLSTIHTLDELKFVEQRFDDILVGHHDASLYITGQDGRVFYASPSPDFSAIAKAYFDDVNGSTLRQWNDSNSTYRVLIQSVDNGGRSLTGPHMVAVAVPIDHHLRFLASFRRSLWFMIAGGIGLISLFGWIAVRKGHRPLHDIVALIRRISANELNTRLSPEAVPGELAELAVSFNDMLERVDGAFHRLSDFNADIAHELRTPIANLMTQTEVGLSRARTTDEYREILYSNLEEYERMAQMVGDMLFLAQSDNRQRRQNATELDLATEVRALFEFYEDWAQERGVSLALEGAATVTGDRLMLQRALGNLLSNAVRHTPAGGTVRVQLDTSIDGETTIVVENPGMTIPPEHIPRLFDRFYRIDPSRQQGDQGVGLGLAIVMSIVNAHAGEINVVSADGHTRFIVTLPARSAPRIQQGLE